MLSVLLALDLLKSTEMRYRGAVALFNFLGGWKNLGSTSEQSLQLSLIFNTSFRETSRYGNTRHITHNFQDDPQTGATSWLSHDWFQEQIWLKNEGEHQQHSKDCQVDGKWGNNSQAFPLVRRLTHLNFFAQRTQVEELFIKPEISSLLKKNLIQPNKSAWWAQLHVVHDEVWGKKRLVVDYSGTVNPHIIPDAYPCHLLKSW